MNSPSDAVKRRGDCYKEGDYHGVYEQYSRRSEFRLFFPEAAQYAEHAKHSQSKDALFAGLEIIQEKIQGNLAEVRFTEHFMEGENAEYVRYFTRAMLTFEDGGWRILKEDREITAKE